MFLKLCLSNCFNRFPYLKEFHLYIDVNNVAHHGSDGNKAPKLENIIILGEHLRKLGFAKEKIHYICDPGLKYYTDRRFEFEALIMDGLVVVAPKVADEFILSYALRHDFCFIISNDKFREYLSQLPNKKWIEERRIPFMFIGNEVCLCPNISYEQVDLLPLDTKNCNQDNEESTLNVLEKIKETSGVFDLF